MDQGRIGGAKRPAPASQRPFRGVVSADQAGGMSMQWDRSWFVQIAMFGVLGYIFVRLGCEGAPFLLGLVLGPQMEEYFRRAMLLSRGDPMVFLQRPISLGLLITTALLLILMALPSIKKAREEAFQEEES